MTSLIASRAKSNRYKHCRAYDPKGYPADQITAPNRNKDSRKAGYIFEHPAHHPDRKRDPECAHYLQANQDLSKQRPQVQKTIQQKQADETTREINDTKKQVADVRPILPHPPTHQTN